MGSSSLKEPYVVEFVSDTLDVFYIRLVFFLNPDHEGEEGPPFGITMEKLRDLFRSEFELVWSEPPAKTFSSREGEGRELCMLWQKKATDFVAHN